MMYRAQQDKVIKITIGPDVLTKTALLSPLRVEILLLTWRLYCNGEHMPMSRLPKRIS